MKSDKRIQYAEYASQLEKQVNNADDARETSLNRLAKIHKAKAKSQERELKRISKKFGEESEKVTAQANKIKHTEEINRYLEVTIKKASHQKTEAIRDAYIVKGRVMGERAQALAGVIVELKNARGTSVAKPVKTDSDGYYQIVLDSIKDAENSKELFVDIQNRDGVSIHKEARPLVAKANTIEARDILIQAKGADITKTEDVSGVKPPNKKVPKARAKAKAVAPKRKSPPKRPKQ